MELANKVFLLTLLLSLIMSVAAVSAAENTTFADDVGQSEDLNHDDLKYSTEGEISDDNEFKDVSGNAFGDIVSQVGILDDSGKSGCQKPESFEILEEGNNCDNPIIQSETPIMDVMAQVNGFNVTVIVMCTGEGQVYFTFEGVEYRKDISNDFVVFNIKNVAPNNYSVNVHFVGNERWEDATETLTFTVDEASPVLEVEATVRGFDVDVAVVSSGEGQVYFTLDGIEYRQNVVNGVANFNLKKIRPEDYFTRVYFDGSEYWENAEDILAFSISKQTPAFEVTPIIRGLDVEVVVMCAGEGQIHFTLDGTEYRQNIYSGIVTFIIKGLSIGNYSTTVYFEGDEFWLNVNKSLNFTLNRPQASINAENRAYSIVYGGTYTVKTNALNQKVTFKLNGRSYSTTSGSDGVAKIKLTKSMLKTAGTKIMTVEVIGDNYLPAIETYKIKVNHEKTKFVVKKSYQFKNSKKTKKIKITLKDSKNNAVKKVKVTFKIKGKAVRGKKSFTLKTNKKGVVTFNLKKTKFTKTGKYSATLQFKGNNQYGKVTKNVKLLIK